MVELLPVFKKFQNAVDKTTTATFRASDSTALMKFRSNLAKKWRRDRL